MSSHDSPCNENFRKCFLSKVKDPSCLNFHILQLMENLIFFVKKIQVRKKTVVVGDT